MVIRELDLSPLLSTSSFVRRRQQHCAGASSWAQLLGVHSPMHDLSRMDLASAGEFPKTVVLGNPHSHSG